MKHEEQIPLFSDLPEPEIELYQPCNGTEGDIFFSRYCFNCAHDFDVCDIVFHTMTYDIKDHEYPREWQIINGKPTCTKFKEIEK